MTVTLLQGDCLDLLPTLAPASVDLILADLPYGTTACKWDCPIDLTRLWKEYKRVLKPRGAVVLTASQPFTTDLINSNRAWFKYTWVWNKNNSAGFALAPKRPMMIHEDVVVFMPGGMWYHPQMVTRGTLRNKSGYSKSDAYGIQPSKSIELSNTYYPKSIIEIGNANQAGKQHPTQKPVALMAYLIRTYTDPGMTVLDNTMGSGTTGVACIETGRAFIGMEKDPAYYALAATRLAQAQPALLEAVGA